MTSKRSETKENENPNPTDPQVDPTDPKVDLQDQDGIDKPTDQVAFERFRNRGDLARSQDGQQDPLTTSSEPEKVVTIEEMGIGPRDPYPTAEDVDGGAGEGAGEGEGEAVRNANLTGRGLVERDADGRVIERDADGYAIDPDRGQIPGGFTPSRPEDNGRPSPPSPDRDRE